MNPPYIEFFFILAGERSLDFPFPYGLSGCCLPETDHRADNIL